MDFSDSTSCTGPTPVVSPDGRCVAFMQEYRLTVRDVETQELVQVFSCAESVESLAWSPTGEHILCVLSGRALVQVFSIADLLWSCTINEGAAGVLRALWSGTGRHVVVVPDFCIRLSVWNLSDDSVQTLPGPKFYDRGIDLHPDGTHLAVLGVSIRRHRGRIDRRSSPAEQLTRPPLPSRSAPRAKTAWRCTSAPTGARRCTSL